MAANNPNDNNIHLQNGLGVAGERGDGVNNHENPLARGIAAVVPAVLGNRPPNNGAAAEDAERRAGRLHDMAIRLRHPMVIANNMANNLLDQGDDVIADVDGNDGNNDNNQANNVNQDDEEDEEADDEAFLLGDEPEENAENPQRQVLGLDQAQNNNNEHAAAGAAAAAINNPQMRRRQLLQRRLLVALRVVFGNFLRQRTTLELNNFRLKRTLLDAILRKLRVVCGNEHIATSASQHNRGQQPSCPFPTALSLQNCKFSDGGAARFGDLLEYLSPSLKQVSIGYPAHATHTSISGSNVFVVVQPGVRQVNGAPADQFPRAAGQEVHRAGPQGHDPVPEAAGVPNNNDHGNDAVDNDNAQPNPVSARAQRLRQRQLRREQQQQEGQAERGPALAGNGEGNAQEQPGQAVRRPQQEENRNNDLAALLRGVEGNNANGNGNQQEDPLADRARAIANRAVNVVAAIAANHNNIMNGGNDPHNEDPFLNVQHHLAMPQDLAQWFEEHMANPAAALIGQPVGLGNIRPVNPLFRAAAMRENNGNNGAAANGNVGINNNQNADNNIPREGGPNNQAAGANENQRNANNNGNGTSGVGNNNAPTKLLTHDHAVALLTGLLSCSNLEKLQLQGLGLRNEGIVRLLCTVIKNCENLGTINLQACRFNARSMYQLTQAFCLIPITQQYLPQQALQDQLQFPKQRLRLPTLQHLRLTESEWINDSMLQLLLRDVALHCTALRTLDLSGNPCITGAGALPLLTSFLLKHSTVEDFKVQLALPKSMIPVPLAGSTKSKTRSASPPQRVICEDLPDTFLLQNFCSALRQHPSLKHLQISASIQRPEASNTNSQTSIMPNNTVAPPPEMAVALMRVAVQSSCRLQTLKLPKLLQYYKNKKDHPNWQNSSQSPTGGLASARHRLKAFRFDPDTSIENDECSGSESLLEVFGQDETTSPSYPNEKAVQTFWKGIMNLSDLSREVILWNHTGTGPHFSDMGDAMSRLVLNGQLSQLRCDGSHKEVPLDSLLGSQISNSNGAARSKLHTLELIQVPITKSQFESVSNTNGALLHHVLHAKCLKSFSLHRNLLTSHTLPLWTSFLRMNPQLLHLCLSGNPNLFLTPLEENTQSDGDESMASQKNQRDFVAAVKEHDSLQSLNLYYCGLKKNPLSIDLLTSFDTNETRKLLKLDFCIMRRSATKKLRMIMSYVSDELTQELARGIGSMRNVESVQLNNWDRRNRIRFQDLLPVILSNQMGIQEFSINSLNSPRPGTQSFLPILADSLESHPTLHTLRLNGQDMSDTREGRLSVLNALNSENAPLLRVLSLHRLSLTSDYMEPLSRLIRHQKQLQELAILSCPVMREEYDNVQAIISSLIEALTSHPSLKKLSLRDCIWNSATLMHFFQAMRNSKIEMLDMGWGCLDSKISEWTESIPHLKNLKYLKVPRDLWTDDRWSLFVQRLRQNTSICSIQYDSARMVIFAHELKEPDSIWGGSAIPDEEVKKILRRNQMLKQSQRLVRKPVAASVAPRVLHLFGAQNEGSAIFTFLRSFQSGCGSWSEGAAHHAKKRGLTRSHVEHEVFVSSPSAKRRRVGSSPSSSTAAASLSITSNNEGTNPSSAKESYAATLEKVRSEIWLNHGGTVTLKDLLQILGVKKSTASSQLKKVIRQLCDMKKKGTSNVLVLKAQYQFQRKPPPPSS